MKTRITAVMSSVMLALVAASHADITYFDAPSSESGTTIVVDSITTVWQQHTGTDFIDFDDSASVDQGANSGEWVLRTTGPAVNAAETTAYNVPYNVNAVQNRIVFSGLDADTEYNFYFYFPASPTSWTGGARVGIFTDTTQTTLYDSLTASSRDAGSVEVLSNGDEGSSASGDKRYRNDLGIFEGSTSYAFIVDNRLNQPVDDRSSFDGIGIEAIPEPAVICLVALFGGGLLFVRRKLAL